MNVVLTDTKTNNAPIKTKLTMSRPRSSLQCYDRGCVYKVEAKSKREHEEKRHRCEWIWRIL